ncbi:hypothetical protein SMD11_1211 [Streptomyces albireticuli]|uniref:Uncharacterized protein n=1 Tax=Streptomyces albireticuli TaxID=1940 RepID=A0A1Z2KXT7_9ACTN|nr:hypothetical protein SMD11_1211 [Streptomyces albireticuli]
MMKVAAAMLWVTLWAFLALWAIMPRRNGP